MRDRVLVSKVGSFIAPYISLKSSGSPLDTLLLKFHYKISVGVFLCLFTAVTSFWFITDPMKCVLKFDRRVVDGLLEDICLSYPYVYNVSVKEFPRSRVYALHYRWVHYAILILVFLYNLPLSCRKYLDRKYIDQLILQLSAKSQEEKTQALNLLRSHIGRLGCYYWKILLLHWILILLNIFSFVFLDIILQNRFARLIPLDYPFTRWPQYFNDTISIAFPPFAECKVGPEMMILMNREETIGCSLPLMVYYQIIFISLWIWIVFLTLWSLITLLSYLKLGMCSCSRTRLLKIEGSRSNLKTCLKYLGVGDLIVMNKIQTYVTGAEFRDLIREVSKMILDEKENGIYKYKFPKVKRNFRNISQNSNSETDKKIV